MTSTRTPLQLLCSYASDAVHDASRTPQWLLFARQQSDRAGGGSFIFSVVVPTTASTCAFYESRLDNAALEQQIEELGIEVPMAAFMELLVKTLAVRKCVDVALGDVGVDAAADDIHVVLTYKFSETISRKGRVALRNIASDMPLAMATLLLNLHANKHTAVLTDAQTLQAKTDAAITAAATMSGKSSSRQASRLSTDSQPLVTTSSSQETDAGASAATEESTPAVNAQLLKRRHLPTGTARRKGPRGAKLAKIE